MTTKNKQRTVITHGEWPVRGKKDSLYSVVVKQVKNILYQIANACYK